jgi:hypothetical protein
MTHIVRAFAIFKKREKAVELCCNRFDSATKEAFMRLYDNVANPVPEQAPAKPYLTPTVEDTEVPF